jgi:hypothetical protein
VTRLTKVAGPAGDFADLIDFSFQDSISWRNMDAARERSLQSCTMKGKTDVTDIAHE